MTDPLERQKKITAVLADRIAVLLSFIEEDGLNAWIEGDEPGAEYLETIRNLVWGFDNDSEYRRLQQRGRPSFHKSKDEVREMLKEILRQVYREAA